MSETTKDVVNAVCWFVLGLLFVAVPVWISGSSDDWVISAITWICFMPAMLAAGNVHKWRRHRKPKRRKARK